MTVRIPHLPVGAASSPLQVIVTNPTLPSVVEELENKNIKQHDFNAVRLL